MQYLIYKTTNIINNKIYVGRHKTKNINDGYLGSGTYLMQDIEKFGKDKFKRETLYEFNNQEDMDTKEREIVDEVFVARLDTYNVNLGGDGGWDLINNDPILRDKYTKNARQAYRNKLLLNPEYRDHIFSKISATRKLMYENGYVNDFKGKKHTEESKRKIGEANSKHQSGKGNSQYGTCWVYSTKLQISRRIYPEDLLEYLNSGWTKGRKIKWLI